MTIAVTLPPKPKGLLKKEWFFDLSIRKLFSLHNGEQKNTAVASFSTSARVTGE